MLLVKPKLYKCKVGTLYTRPGHIYEVLEVNSEYIVFCGTMFEPLQLQLSSVEFEKSFDSLN